MADSLGSAVLTILSRPRRLSTAALAIGGGQSYPLPGIDRSAWITKHAEATQLPPERIGILLERYGSRAAFIAAFCAEEFDYPLIGAPTYSEREIRFLIRHEMAVTLNDIVLRRTQLALTGQISRPLLEAIADILAEETGLELSPRIVEDCLAELAANTVFLCKRSLASSHRRPSNFKRDGRSQPPCNR